MGGSIFDSCSWVEAAIALTMTQLPGIYLQPDKDVLVVFDNIHAEKVKVEKGRYVLRLTNPTRFPAEVTIFSETAEDTKKPLSGFSGKEKQTISLRSGEVKEVVLTII